MLWPTNKTLIYFRCVTCQAGLNTHRMYCCSVGGTVHAELKSLFNVGICKTSSECRPDGVPHPSLVWLNGYDDWIDKKESSAGPNTDQVAAA